MDRLSRKIVADEQLIDDDLDFFGIQVDVPAPPSLEAEITRSWSVDLGIEIVLLATQRVGGIEALEILDQPGAVEPALAEIARHRGEPAAAKEAAAVAHGILATHTGPVREWRSGNDDRAEQLRA